MTSLKEPSRWDGGWQWPHLICLAGAKSQTRVRSVIPHIPCRLTCNHLPCNWEWKLSII